jgi:hypothetical protein
MKEIINFFLNQSKAEKFLKRFRPSHTLTLFGIIFIFFISSYDKSKFQLSKFSTNRWGFDVLGITPTPLIKLNFKTTWAAVLLYLEATSLINSYFKMFTSYFWQLSPLAKGVWAITVIPFFVQKSTRLCWGKYGWVSIWLIIGLILQ